MRKNNWSTKRYAYLRLLIFCCLVLLPVFVYAVTNSVAARKQSARQDHSRLRADAPQISHGALTDLERQSNPEMFSRYAQASADETGRPRGARENPGLQPNFPPLATNTFDAINFNENASLNGFFQIPPDPSGASGITHVVNVTNSAIEWYTKAGVRQNRQTLSSFFAGATNPPQTLTFDPKVVFDHYYNRFVVVTMERIEASGMTPNQSRVYVGISDDADPNGTWFFQTLQTEETINGRQSWADFPGLAFDFDAVYFTTNMFAHNNQTQAGVFQGQRLWIIPKLPLYTGGQSVLNRIDPTAVANLRAGEGFGDGALATTMQPTIMFGDNPNSELGTYLVAYSGINDFVSGSDANLFVQVIEIANPLGVNGPPRATGYFSQWGTIQVNDNLFSGFPGAPQNLTTRRIATNDRRVSQNAVFRNGLLFLAAPILEPTASTEAGQVSAHWFILNPLVIATNIADPPPQDQGDIGGEEIAPGTFTFFPAVAVSAGGDLGVSFAASAPSIFAGSYFAGRLASDPPTTIRPASTLRAGQDRYIRDFTTSMTVTSRWGDYTSASIDPTDNTTYWVFNEHALPRGTILGGLPEEDGRWGNAWGNFSLTSPAAPTSLPLIISEFRNRGPNGETDEFIEIYNNSGNSQTVVAIDGSDGFAVVAQDGVTRCVIPNGTVFPARGHYLCASPAYSLAAYSAANIYYFTPDIGDTQGIALFNSSTPANFTLANRLDAFGYTSSPPLYREGGGYPIILTFNTNHTFYRDRLNVIGNTPKDTNDNSADFVGVNANPEIFNYGIGLGAPGPENLTSPLQRSETTSLTIFDSGAAFDAVPNQERNATPVTNGSLGTLILRRTITNNTGAAVTRLRLRVIDITTLNTPQSATPGQPSPCGPPICSDLRVLSSSDEAAVSTSTGPKETKATILEEPPAQPNGGGYNSSLNVPFVTSGTPLANGASVNVVFRLGVNREGTYRFFFIVEALP